MYECHITTDPLTPEQRDTIAYTIMLYNFRLAKLLMAKDGPESSLDTFMTGHHDDFAALSSNAHQIVRTLQAFHINVRRVKFEYIVLDTKRGDLFAGVNDANHPSNESKTD